MEDKAEKRIQEIEAKNPKSKFKVMSVGEIMIMKFEGTGWLIEGIIPEQGITILSGAPASYKTWLLLQMALNIAKGEKFLDQFPCKQAGVLIIDEEDHLRMIQDRLKLLEAEDGLAINFISQSNFAVLENKDVEEVIKICEEKKADVIFIDSLVRISDNDENAAKDMSLVFKGIRKFCQAGKTIVITHHERKEGFVKAPVMTRLRGSSDIPASVDSIIAVQRDKNDKYKLKFEQGKNRFAQEIDSFGIRVINENEKVIFKIEGLQSDQQEDDIHEAIIEVLRLNEEGSLIKEIVEAIREPLSVSEGKIKKILSKMIKDGEIVTKPGAKNEKRCFLAETAEDDLPP